MDRRGFLAFLGLGVPAAVVAVTTTPAAATAASGAVASSKTLFVDRDLIYNGVILRNVESIDDYGQRVWIDWARHAMPADEWDSDDEEPDDPDDWSYCDDESRED